jgi:hypothetical protein
MQCMYAQCFPEYIFHFTQCGMWLVGTYLAQQKPNSPCSTSVSPTRSPICSKRDLESPCSQMCEHGQITYLLALLTSSNGLLLLVLRTCRMYLPITLLRYLCRSPGRARCANRLQKTSRGQREASTLPRVSGNSFTSRTGQRPSAFLSLSQAVLVMIDVALSKPPMSTRWISCKQHVYLEQFTPH